ncbi:hypothetical protein ACIBL3_39205 [Kribbella sp. NPDC050124]|uniref:hypothetical protein n=1 Tax=Kribbella sp. NPDC050124 TaxID=3364114 RepID=UPI0037B2C1DE
MNDLLRLELAPEDVTSWLAANDWRRVPASQETAALWVRSAHEVLQPLAPGSTDYRLRLADLLRTLARAEKRDALLITQEILSEGADVCEWRATGEQINQYTIPLDDGDRLVHGARTAFVAAANATVHRRGYFGHSIAKAAREHAKSVRMGQTMPGSYIVPIISHVSGSTLVPGGQEDGLDIRIDAQPFGRRVMIQLAEALSTIQDLAVDADPPNMRRINESVGHGVSHELCAAVSEVLAADSVDGLDVSFAWARRLPVRDAVERIRLPKASLPNVQGIAESLRGSQVVAEQTIVGIVRGTRRDPAEEFGLVTIRAPIGSTDRLVHMWLGRDDFHQALMAADEERLVYVTGTLAREPGRQWKFESITNFGYAEFMSEQDQ